MEYDSPNTREKRSEEAVVSDFSTHSCTSREKLRRTHNSSHEKSSASRLLVRKVELRPERNEIRMDAEEIMLRQLKTRPAAAEEVFSLTGL